MGNPDGGWFDEVPPRVVGATPADHAVNVKQKKIDINFSEYIKLENASENVVVCPPQLEQPEIKTQGKNIRVELKDSLKENTTYTIDFSDAISDNNESNPMGNYTYVFSTGDHIDTLEVSGYVLNAEDLEPVKGSLVGLYSNLNDSAFTTLPMLRAGRTDASGHFVIRGVAPGQYRVYSLADTDGDFKLSQRGEQLGFSHDIIVPSSKPDVRQDTTWVDSLHIGGISQEHYTHFLPDDICLCAFTQQLTDRYLIKTERKDPDHFSVYFSTGSDTLPKLRALNYDDKNAYVIETSEKKDTITYWLRDTILVNQDTLRTELTYYMTDSIGALVLQTDTIEMLSKVPYAKRLKQRLEEQAKWEKKAEKERKKGREPEPPKRENVLKPKFTNTGNISPAQNIIVAFDTPLERIDTAGIHLYSKIDTLWYNSPCRFVPDSILPRTYMIQGEWRPEVEYSLEIDSAAFVDIYGNVNDAAKQGVKIKSDAEFSSLFVNVKGIDAGTGQIIISMLDKGGKVQQTSIVNDGTAEFYYVKPGDYYLSALVDANKNGKWDTGDYALDQQAEVVYYRPDAVTCKEKWDVTTDFNVTNIPPYEQKPRSMVKQKGDKKKTVKNQNMRRAQQLGIVYDKDKVNSKF